MAQTTSALISENIILTKKILTDYNQYIGATTVERKNVSYCKKRLDILENQWEALELNHRKIMQDDQLNPQCDCLRNDVRGTAEGQYKSYGKDLQDQIYTLENPTTAPRQSRMAHNVVMPSELGATGGSTPATDTSQRLHSSVENLFSFHLEKEADYYSQTPINFGNQRDFGGYS